MSKKFSLPVHLFFIGLIQLLVLESVRSHSSVALVHSYRLMDESEKTRLLDTCMRNKVSRFGAIDLKVLKNAIEGVDFFETNLSMEERVGPRRSGFYRKGTVFIAPNLPEEAHDLLVLHEGLGALGFYDKNYELSTLISIFCHASPKDRVRIHTLKKNSLFYSTFKRVSIAGGFTIVGGGGDAISALFKYQLLKKCLKLERQCELSVILNLRIEPSTRYQGQDPLLIGRSILVLPLRLGLGQEIFSTTVDQILGQIIYKIHVRRGRS